MSTTWTIAFVALFTLTGGLAVIVLGMLRRMLAVLERTQYESGLHGTVLPEAPDSPSFDVVGTTVPPLPGHAWSDLGDSTVVFLEVGCEGCRTLALDVAVGRKRVLASGQSLAFVVDGTSDGFAQLPPEFPVVVDEHRALIRAWGIQSSPVAYFVSAHGYVVAASHPHSLQDVLGLRARVAAAQLVGD